MKLKKQNKSETLRSITKTRNYFWIKNISIILLFVFFIVLNIFQPQGDIKWAWHYAIWMPITTYIVLWEGRKYLKVYRKAIMGIFDMDTLIGIASHVLLIFSIVMSAINYDKPMYSYEVMWEGPVALIIVTNIGHFIEDSVKNGSVEAYKKLEEMRNSEVILIKDNKETIVLASEIKIGDLIIVKKGSFVGLDGLVQSTSTFDYSNITGESQSIHLSNGEFVVSGAYNVGEAVLIKVTKRYDESTISKIVENIENVTMAKPKMQKFSDKLLRWFVPVILITSLLTFTIWIIITSFVDVNLPWLENKSGLGLSISSAVTLLAVACPCALGIATPLVYVVSSTLSVNNGIMINNPVSLEELSGVKIFAFDKTGTITCDEFEISNITGNKAMIGVAKGLEQNVKHPIASTIMNLASEIETVTNISTKHEEGVKGTWQGKEVSMKRYKDGNASTTNVALYINNKPVLIFELENIIKPGVIETIKFLKKRNIKTIMITGDEEAVAKAVGDKIGIDEIRANVKPNSKAQIIKELQKTSKVAFVGDGFNDSIAIKQADVSIAFASGSDITNSLSDVSLIKNDFTLIKKILELSKMNNRKVKIALTYAFAFNIIVMPIAILSLIQPWMGASMMALSSIMVSLNALLYKKTGQKRLDKI